MAISNIRLQKLVLLCVLLPAVGVGAKISREVYARKQFCEQTLADFRGLRNRARVFGGAGDVQEFSEEIQSFLKSMGQEAALADFQHGVRNAESTADVWDAFKTTAAGYKLSGKLNHLKQLWGKLSKLRKFEGDQEELPTWSPYVFHSPLKDLALLDVDAGHRIFKEWIAESQRDFILADLSQGIQRNQIGKIAAAYSSFLKGREEFVSKRPSVTQISTEYWIARTVITMGHGEGLGNLRELILRSAESNPHFDEPNRQLVLLRMMFITQMFYPGAVESQSRRKLIPWIASFLTDADIRPFGVKYAALMNLLLIHQQHRERLAIKMLSGLIEGKVSVPQDPHLLQGIQPLLEETLTSWKKSPPVDSQLNRSPAKVLNFVSILESLISWISQVPGHNSDDMKKQVAQLLEAGWRYTSVKDQIEKMLSPTDSKESDEEAD